MRIDITMRLLTNLLLLLGAAVSVSEAFEPYPDLLHNYCGLARETRWPWNRRHGELNPKANNALFRLITEEDVRTVKSGKEYSMSLRAIAPDVHIHRFVITAVDDDDDESCGYGKLRSQSDVSEHINYSCGRFLLDRNPTSGLLEVPFTWEPPSCGCVQLRAQVLDADDNFYTSDLDPIFGLSVLACVEGTSFEHEAVKRWKAAEAEVEAELAAAARKHTLEAKVIDHAEKHHRRKRRNARRHCCRGGIDARCPDCDEADAIATCDDAMPSDELFARAEAHEMGHELCWDVFHDCCLDVRSIEDFKHEVNVGKRRETNKQRRKQIKRAERKAAQREKRKKERQEVKAQKERELAEIHAEQQAAMEARKERKEAANEGK